MPYLKIEDRRAASRRHYDRNSTSMKDRAAVQREIARQRNREYIAAIKSAAPCADCGISYPPYIMQFDHCGEDKDRDVASLAGAPVSIKRLQAEINKCEIVCANCHAERTYLPTSSMSASRTTCPHFATEGIITEEARRKRRRCAILALGATKPANLLAVLGSRAVVKARAECGIQGTKLAAPLRLPSLRRSTARRL